MHNSAKTGLLRRFCPNPTEKHFYYSLSTRQYTKQYSIHTKGSEGWRGTAQAQAGEAARTPGGCRRAEGEPRLSLHWLSSGNGWRQECLWNRNQLLLRHGAQETLPKDLPTAHLITPSESVTLTTGWSYYSTCSKLTRNCIWLLVHLAKRWVWEKFLQQKLC